MTNKTKAQLRAEAVERLRGTGRCRNIWYVIRMAVNSDVESPEDARFALVDLLTDEPEPFGKEED